MVMELLALEAAALILASYAALIACTVLPPLTTVQQLSLRRPSLQRWLPLSRSSVTAVNVLLVLMALEAVALWLAGNAALMACGALQPLITVLL